MSLVALVPRTSASETFNSDKMRGRRILGTDEGMRSCRSKRVEAESRRVNQALDREVGGDTCRLIVSRDQVSIISRSFIIAGFR